MKRTSVALVVLMAVLLALPQVGFCFRPPPPPHPRPPIGIPPGARYHHHGGSGVAGLVGGLVTGLVVSEIVRVNQPPPPPPPQSVAAMQTTPPVNCNGTVMSRVWIIDGKPVTEYACFQK